MPALTTAIPALDTSQLTVHNANQTTSLSPLLMSVKIPVPLATMVIL